MPMFRLFLLAGCMLVTSACQQASPPPEAAAASMRITTEGEVTGFADRFETWSWRGIPYAQAPIAELRWRAPQPPLPRSANLDALEFSAMCPQLPIPLVNRTSEKWLGAEDCLYLNISAPRSWQPGDAPLPVMVWLHGGGNSVGSADQYVALRNLATREQLVVVSINYRLGILGWFRPPALQAQAKNSLDSSGNFGTLDTIQALQWVRDNIANFGGDADNVTLFGESAGGFNTFALMLSPLAKDLFHKAIVQSGMLVTTEMHEAENFTDAERPGQENNGSELLLRLLQNDELATDRNAAKALSDEWPADKIMAYLRDKPPELLLGQMQNSESGLYFTPFLLRDGAVLPDEDPLKLLASGRFNAMPVIMGTNRDEMKTMMTRHPDYVRMKFGLLPRVIDQSIYDRVSGYGSNIWRAVGADEPAEAMRLAGQRSIYVYRFDWDQLTPNLLIDFPSLLGAGHSFEIPFVFHDLDNEMSFLPFDFFDADNRAAAAPLADAMTSYWGSFAHTGKPAPREDSGLPDWLPWSEQGRLLVFDDPGQGDLRMEQGKVSRDLVYQAMLAEKQEMGGEQALCTAWQAIFGPRAVFSFLASACPQASNCKGSADVFCPAAAVPRPAGG